LATVQEFWRPIINDFNPIGPVRPEDVSRFFVDRQADDPTRSPLQLLKLSFQDSIWQPRPPYKALLTGHVGSGKSSELMRLGQELAADFFVVWFNAEFTLETETANHFDVLLAMGLAVHAAAQAASLDPDERLAKEFVQSFAKFVRKFEGRKGFSLRVEQILKQVVAMSLGAFGVLPAVTDTLLGATRLELKVSDDLVRTLELPANRRAIVGSLNKIIDGVGGKAKRPVLIITDGLDKVPAGRARKLFADSALLTEPACALVYAAPIEFYHRLIAGVAKNLFDEHHILPNPIVQRRPLTGENWKGEREPNENGLAVMRKVIAKRLEAHGKASAEVITPQALELLARVSGGVMRELISYFRDAVRFAQLRNTMQIDFVIAQNVITQQRQAVALRLNLDHREALRRVLQQGALSGGQREAVEDDLLRGLYLLSYQDDQLSWFDVHPNVLPLL